MKADNVILVKAKKFAVRIIRLNKYLCDEKREYVLSKQLLRSGTSIGANVSEALCGISKKDFLCKTKTGKAILICVTLYQKTG